MKIIIETSLKKIPSCCKRCRYWVPGYWVDDNNPDDGICSVLEKKFHTENIHVRKERLKNCPLREVE